MNAFDMKMKILSWVSLLMVLTVIGTGCAVKSTQPVSKEPPSSQQTQDTDVTYRHPTLRAHTYKKFFIKPITIDVAQGENRLSKEDMALLSEAFYEAAVKALAPDQSNDSLASEPGEGVLVLDVTIKEYNRPKIKPTGEGEVVLKFDGLRQAGRLTLTAFDGATHQKVIVLTQVLKGPRYAFGSDQKRLMQMLEAFRGWGRSLKMRLEEARQRS